MEQADHRHSQDANRPARLLPDVGQANQRGAQEVYEFQAVSPVGVEIKGPDAPSLKQVVDDVSRVCGDVQPVQKQENWSTCRALLAITFSRRRVDLATSGAEEVTYQDLILITTVWLSPRLREHCTHRIRSTQWLLDPISMRCRI